MVGAARSHEGLIEIEFDEAGGLTCRVLLASLKDLETQSVDRVESAGEVGDVLLIADDEEGVLHLTSSILEMHGGMAVTVRRMSEALTALRAGTTPFRALVLDASLFGSEPSEFPELWPDFPVILCSGYDHQRVQEPLTSLDAVAFLQKPFTVEQLMQAVKLTRTPYLPLPRGRTSRARRVILVSNVKVWCPRSRGTGFSGEEPP